MILRPMSTILLPGAGDCGAQISIFPIRGHKKWDSKFSVTLISVPTHPNEVVYVMFLSYQVRDPTMDLYHYQQKDHSFFFAMDPVVYISNVLIQLINSFIGYNNTISSFVFVFLF